jgi:cell division protein FtsZ
MSINLHLPENIILKPRITVFGVGGAGGNAVNNMITSNLEGAKFVIANTDAQALEFSKAENRIQLGETITRGLGAGASPDIGRAAAEEAAEEIMAQLTGSNMVFITAGMGGGTGTGSSSFIAKVAKEQGILTVGVVTKPFHFEGAHRMRIAEAGLAELQKYVDTLIVIPNQNLFRIANEKTTFADAFKLADDVLHAGVRGITDLMTQPGLINLDFADVRSVMNEMGKAMMGTGEAEGENRALVAAESAISNPLLDHTSMKGAKGVLINITGGSDMTLFEVDEAANRIREEVDPDANIIFGSAFNSELEGKIRVSVVATGIDDPLLSSQKNNNTSDNKIKAFYTASNNHKQSNNIDVQDKFNRSNIPTYSPVPKTTSLDSDQAAPIEKNPDIDRSYEGGSIFVAPKPMEPKLYTASMHGKEEFSNSVEAASNEYEQEADKEEEYRDNHYSEPRSLGLFGRILAGREDKQKEKKEPEKVLATDDFSDIPAYQRRNKGNDGF